MASSSAGGWFAMIDETRSVENSRKSKDTVSSAHSHFEISNIPVVLLAVAIQHDTEAS